MQKYCIANIQNTIMSFLLDGNGHTLEIHCDTPDSRVLLGNIYVGKVKNIAKNLQAAFVEILPGVICYLPLEDLRAPLYTKKGSSPNLQQGDELVVQISREAIKTKAPSLTTNLCFQGKYVILEAGKTGIGVSRKLPEEERERLRSLGQRTLEKLKQGEKIRNASGVLDAAWPNTSSGQIPQQSFADRACDPPYQLSIVLRTNAANFPEEEIEEELKKLFSRFLTIKETAAYRTCYSCLYQSPALWLRRILSLNYSGLESIVIGDEALYGQAKAYLEAEQPELAGRLIRYQDPLLPMEKLYSMEHRLEEALGERVWMKSGAYLVIQPTEALTVVDVNSGKCETGKKKEAALLKINLEAARETARQLRLRNLSGIIIIDFINMEEEASRLQVMEELRKCLLQDPVQARVIDMTKLDLVEVTRKKVEKTLKEQVSV